MKGSGVAAAMVEVLANASCHGDTQSRTSQPPMQPSMEIVDVAHAFASLIGAPPPDLEGRSEASYPASQTSTTHETRVIDLLQLNCEGCELAVLQRLLSLPSLAAALRVIEVQFHLAAVPPLQLCEIEASLRANDFRLVYRYPYVWERWVRNNHGEGRGGAANLSAWKGLPRAFKDAAEKK